MDRITLALGATEDNAAAIRAINKSLAQRTGCKLLVGTTGDGTSFGNVTSNGTAGIVVTFAGAAVTLTFCGNNIVTSSGSPIIAVLPPGSGELKLTGSRLSARALVIGQ